MEDLERRDVHINRLEMRIEDMLACTGLNASEKITHRRVIEDLSVIHDTFNHVLEKMDGVESIYRETEKFDENSYR